MYIWLHSVQDGLLDWLQVLRVLVGAGQGLPQSVAVLGTGMDPLMGGGHACMPVSPGLGTP